MCQNRLRHAVVQNVATFVRLIENLYAWSLTAVNDITETIVKNTHTPHESECHSHYQSNKGAANSLNAWRDIIF